MCKCKSEPLCWSELGFSNSRNLMCSVEIKCVESICRILWGCFFFTFHGFVQAVWQKLKKVSLPSVANPRSLIRDSDWERPMRSEWMKQDAVCKEGVCKSWFRMGEQRLKLDSCIRLLSLTKSDARKFSIVVCRCSFSNLSKPHVQFLAAVTILGNGCSPLCIYVQICPQKKEMNTGGLKKNRKLKRINILETRNRPGHLRLLCQQMTKPSLTDGYPDALDS